MLRFSLANCSRYNVFPAAPKGDEVTAILVKVSITPVQNIYPAVKGQN